MELKPTTASIIDDLMYLTKFPANNNAPYICRIAAEGVIEECEEAFYDRCHDDYGHPTIKPESIVRNFVLNSSIENEIILDPFMGSGTTGVACINTGRKFIDIELVEEYFETAKKRIEEVNATAAIKGVDVLA